MRVKGAEYKLFYCIYIFHLMMCVLPYEASSQTGDVHAAGALAPKSVLKMDPTTPPTKGGSHQIMHDPLYLHEPFLSLKFHHFYIV